MADIGDLNRYFAQPGDAINESERVPLPTPQNAVDYLIDGANYFGRIADDIEDLLRPTPAGTDAETNKFFYFTNWWLGLTQIDYLIRAQTAPPPAPIDSPLIFSMHPFQLREPSLTEERADRTDRPFIEKLVQMAEPLQAIDVRAFPWISAPLIMTPDVLGELVKNTIRANNIHTLRSVDALRRIPGMEAKVAINMLAHPMAGMHLKMVVLGSNRKIIAYVGGMDFVNDRLTDQNHIRTRWHDVGVRIAGPAAIELYDYFRSLWNEQIFREPWRIRVGGVDRPILTHVRGHRDPTKNTPIVPEYSGHFPAGIDPSRTKYVQILRTLPRMTFGSEGRPGAGLAQTFGFCVVHSFQPPPLSFATSGSFSFLTAIRKAIAQARKYIYMEDQSFWSLDIMRFLVQRLNEPDPPKVIFVHGPDPADGVQATDAAMLYPKVALHFLFSNIPPSLRNNIAFYERGGRTIHSKLRIIDDVWVAVGSTNSTRRSLYADGEVSVAIIDEAAAEGYSLAMGFAQDLRVALWSEHCGHSEPISALVPIDDALGIWDTDWGLPGPSGVNLVTADILGGGGFRRVTIADPVTFDPVAYDQTDPDTRQVF